MDKPKALVLGKKLCFDCQSVKARYECEGYEVEFKDIDKDADAFSLHQLLDGGETVPVTILRGVVREG